MNPMQPNEKDSTIFERVINVLNFMFAIAALVIAIISFCVAVKSLRVAFFSFRYTKLGYEASKRTADNVMRASFNVQKGQFNDLIRHLYRNLVCTLAFTQKILGSVPDEVGKGKKEISQYPSEEHLWKMIWTHWYTSLCILSIKSGK